MKKYLFIALAALGFAACAEHIDGPNAPIHNGELEESYIAINLMSADSDTRAIDDDPYGNADEYGYEDGTDAERLIKTAYFFFFDENGNPFNVTGAPATAPGGAKNHLSLTIGNTTGKGDPNVSDIKEAVLILNTYKGVYPKQVVAVLNWTPRDIAYSLSDLHDELATIGNDDAGYVMSNSVYMNSGNKMVDAVPLTDANIKKSADEAKNTPVEIYVERVAAKVVLTASGKVADNNIFSTKTTSQLVTLSEITATPVYVQLNGWELYNDYATSNLLKNIDTTWSVEDLGLTWNDIPYFRCYWADSQDTDIEDSFSWSYQDYESKGFKTAYGFGIAAANDKYATRSTYTYCGENTNGEKLRTKVILKGQLMQKNGETYEPLELASWYGNEYAGEENLKRAVANSLAYTLFYANGTDANGNNIYTSISYTDIDCVAGGTIDPEAKAYDVYFKLSDAGDDKTWYQYSTSSGYQLLGSADNHIDSTNAYLAANVEPALLYTKGQTYYILDIKHLGAAGKTAEFGVVRNHVYQIDIKSIQGYGSPYYGGLSNIVTPEYPEKYDDTYVAARINVLSWKVVKQGVDIVQ